MSNLLISLNQLSLAFGLDALLDNASLQIESGERVCLIGRNGAGKSSLLKIIEGTLLPDQGTVWRKPQLKLATLTQTLPQENSLTVYEYVASGLAETGKLLADYHELTHHLADSSTKETLKRLEKLQHAIDAKNGWQFDQQIQTILTKLTLPPDKKMHELSGGWQRRAALAQALVCAPELLLLDEPTNHLDIEAIQWLEDQLMSMNIGLVFITHDRSFLKRVATRILELDRGKLTSWPGNYQQFLQHKEELLHAEKKQNTEFDKKLAAEERWIRQGIKARRTRNEGRVRALEALRLQRSKRREQQGKASFNLNEVKKSGKLVIEAKDISHAYNNIFIIKDFSLNLMRGDRIGLLGPNGIGKSTLLNILLKKIPPQQGTVNLGTELNIAYFDQLHQTLDLEKNLIDFIGEGRDTIEINNKKQHIISYLGDFLFTPARALTPIKALSGGERNRLILAKLFSRPANVLVMDEPTNDLDIETLELLEELLTDYQGTLLLVSHDRTFLDNIVTSTLVFSGEGQITEFIGGYQNWLEQKNSSTIKSPESSSIPKQKMRVIKKLSYAEQKELTELPHKIEKLEQAQQTLLNRIADPNFYQQNSEAITITLNDLKQIEKDLIFAYERWEKLEKTRL